MNTSQRTPAPPAPAEALANDAALLDRLRDAGFSFLSGADLFPQLGLTDNPAWSAFAESWQGMARDQYMGDGGRYRFRRYATLSADATGKVNIEPHQPHYQSLDYNRLNGGVARWFEPIGQDVLNGWVLERILAGGTALFHALKPAKRWHIEAHQFRIQASAGEAGKPTPEGVHRDGVDYVLVMMVRRENIASGTTTIHAPDGSLLDRFTLTAPGDAALLDDHRCLHGVTPVTPLDATRPAWRDVLVVTWRAQD